MLTFAGISPVDYLIIGHLTQDLSPDGPRLGGSAAFAGLTAAAFGQRVGVVTSWAEETGLERLSGLQIANLKSEASTTFQNTYTPEGRLQKLHYLAPALAYYHIPESWRKTRIVHLAPVAGEVPADLVRYFPEADLYLTPQGWLREWDHTGNVSPGEWVEATFMLQHARAAVISEEDVSTDQAVIDRMAAAVQILVVTRGYLGAELYWQGNIYTFHAPEVEEIDPTGAGDIFAATFFSQLTHQGDPLRAAELAVQVASDSIQRSGMDGAPDEDILYDMLRKVL